MSTRSSEQQPAAFSAISSHSSFRRCYNIGGTGEHAAQNPLHVAYSASRFALQRITCKYQIIKDITFYGSKRNIRVMDVLLFK